MTIRKAMLTLAFLAFAAAPAVAPRPALGQPPAAVTPALRQAVPLRVSEASGTRLVVQGPAVAELLPRMPVWLSEPDGAGRPGLFLAEGTVLSVVGERAVVQLAGDAVQVRPGALCEPRFHAEARLYRSVLSDGQGTAGAQVKAEPPSVRGRHRAPESVAYGKPMWVEVALDGPAEKAVALYRLGTSGPYAEVSLESKGDGLWGGFLPLREEPGIAVVQYYLVAVLPAPQATPGSPSQAVRQAVAGSPGEPLQMRVDSVPEPERERLVVHGPVDRASHRRPLALTAEINKRFSRPTLFYRARGGASFQTMPMAQVQPELYRAEIPARDVVAPGLAYYIAVIDEKGIVRDGFGSNRDPHPVTVLQPQILSEEENRNKLSVAYAWTDFGRDGDRYHEVEVGLERLFFGFLVARLNGGVLAGRVPRQEPGPDAKAPPIAVDTTLSLYRGRAGLDFHLGDYLSVSTDLAMAIYSQGSGFGYRAGVRIGDEQVAAVSLVLEQIWDPETEEQVVHQWRGTLATPVGDSLRLYGGVVQEAVLRGPAGDAGLRLLAGIELDVGSHLQLDVNGGMAGLQANVGPTVASTVRVRF